MRLFIGIALTEEEKEKIWACADVLFQQLRRGRMAEKELYHITLAFIGESSKAECEVITDLLKDFCFEKFRLEFSSYGDFPAKDGKIFFLKAEEDVALQRVGKALREELSSAGVLFDKKTLKPHITLARSTLLKPESTIRNERPQVEVEVSNITLFRSDRVGGKLLYTTIFLDKAVDKNNLV